MEKILKKNMYNWIILLYTWKLHDIAKQLNFN